LKTTWRRDDWKPRDDVTIEKPRDGVTIENGLLGRRHFEKVAVI
jgi:hypothetical protein